MSKVTPLMIVASDFHLSHVAPASRTEKGNAWYAVMRRHLKELDSLKSAYGAPLVIAGDIFDKWNSCPELINFALDHLPSAYAIPGNHDLPYHNNTQIARSAYDTLVKAKLIFPLIVNFPNIINTVITWAFPWNVEIAPLKKTYLGTSNINVAIVHKYIWHGEHSHPGAPEEANVKQIVKLLDGYNAAIFGDNHKGFIYQEVNGPTIVNCGGLIRRKADEMKYNPSVAIVFSDGMVTRHFLEAPKRERLSDRVQLSALHGTEFNMNNLIDLMKSASDDDCCDFKTYLRLIMESDRHRVSEDCKRMINRILDEVS